jgi:hypothetical protein
MADVEIDWKLEEDDDVMNVSHHGRSIIISYYVSNSSLG